MLEALLLLFLKQTLVLADWVEISQSPGIKIQKVSNEFYQSNISLENVKATTIGYEDIVKKPTITTKVMESTTPMSYNFYTDSFITPPSNNHSEHVEKDYEPDSNWNIPTLLYDVQEDLTKNSDHSVGSKLAILNNLKELLLANVAEKISNLYKSPGRNANSARGYKEDYQMDYPSHEGALMTIGFLTFAVFLIKLVLKLIQALKQKSMFMSTTMAPTAAAIFVGRKRRSIREEHIQEANKILQAIEEYNFKFD